LKVARTFCKRHSAINIYANSMFRLILVTLVPKVLVAVPLFEPQEIFMDVNKAPYPIVNLVPESAESPFQAVSALEAQQLQNQRSNALIAHVAKFEALQKGQQRISKKISELSEQTLAATANDRRPTLNLRLSAPKLPYPSLLAKMGEIEKAHTKKEAAAMSMLNGAYKSAMLYAESRVAQLVGDAMSPFDSYSKAKSFLRGPSFLQAAAKKYQVHENEASVRIRIKQSGILDARFIADVQNMESNRDILSGLCI